MDGLLCSVNLLHKLIYIYLLWSVIAMDRNFSHKLKLEGNAHWLLVHKAICTMELETVKYAWKSHIVRSEHPAEVWHNMASSAISQVMGALTPFNPHPHASQMQRWYLRSPCRMIRPVCVPSQFRRMFLRFSLLCLWFTAISITAESSEKWADL